MSIEGDTSNLRAPAELKPQRGGMFIDRRHVLATQAPAGRSGILPDSKPQRGDMFIDERHVLATQAPAGRHAGSMTAAAHKHLRMT